MCTIERFIMYVGQNGGRSYSMGYSYCWTGKKRAEQCKGKAGKDNSGKLHHTDSLTTITRDGPSLRQLRTQAIRNNGSFQIRPMAAAPWLQLYLQPCRQSRQRLPQHRPLLHPWLHSEPLRTGAVVDDLHFISRDGCGTLKVPRAEPN